MLLQLVSGRVSLLIQRGESSAKECTSKTLSLWPPRMQIVTSRMTLRCLGSEIPTTKPTHLPSDCILGRVCVRFILQFLQPHVFCIPKHVATSHSCDLIPRQLRKQKYLDLKTTTCRPRFFFFWILALGDKQSHWSTSGSNNLLGHILRSFQEISRTWAWGSQQPPCKVGPEPIVRNGVITTPRSGRK